MPRLRRSFSAEFEDEPVKLVTERGLSLAAAARDLNVGESTLGRWVCRPPGRTGRSRRSRGPSGKSSPGCDARTNAYAKRRRS